MGKFTFTQTEIPGVVVIEPQVFGDDRGYFMETYQKDQFAEAGIDKEFVQDNQSRSTRGVLRGLHFQKNHTQGKLVRVRLRFPAPRFWLAKTDAPVAKAS